MRMLMNNLDPEVAERPEDLVVYGGTGRAARSWEAFDAIVRELKRSRRRPDAARAVGQAGRRVRHARMGAARAHLELDARARVGDVGRVPAARGARPDDVRPDDRGLVDLHRHAGHPPGHVRDVRRDRAQAVRRLARGHDHADRRPRRDGRGAAAGGDARTAVSRSASRSTTSASSAGSSIATSTFAPTTSSTRSRSRARRRSAQAAALDRASRQRGGGAARAGARAASTSTSSPTRRRRTTR